ncbi:MAG TPA: precorrin-4 C(11)-methyltransferase [Stellaceae bacterium]|nr:precorrin-4 C(11)-methyltransferase [Stellaceae bacterium]
MTVHFIGAGPGAPDLLTLRARDLIAACPVCLYAGSLVPPEIVAHAPPGARLIDTATMTLDQIIAELRAAHQAGRDVARLQSGDTSIFSAVAEQIRRLRVLGIPYTVTPGVPAFAAAAAALAMELTLPGLNQTVVLTRTSVRSSPMPPGEDLAILGQSGATLAIHLSIQNVGSVVERLVPLYGADCPVAVIYRASWPDQRVLRCRLVDLAAEVAASGIGRTALILVGPALAEDAAFRDSALYGPDAGRRAQDDTWQ